MPLVRLSGALLVTVWMKGPIELSGVLLQASSLKTSVGGNVVGQDAILSGTRHCEARRDPGTGLLWPQTSKDKSPPAQGLTLNFLI